MPPKYKVEFLLPTLYNNKENPELPGEPIEAKKSREAIAMVVKKFNAISKHPATIEGTWIDKNSNIKYFDNCLHLEVCIDKRDDYVKFFEKFKIHLMKEFEQEDIYIICYEVNMI